MIAYLTPIINGARLGMTAAMTITRTENSLRRMEVIITIGITSDIRTAKKQERMNQGRETTMRICRADADTMQRVDDNRLVGVKEMEASDMKHLKQPTKALLKYGKVDGIRILLAEKKKIGTGPVKRFKPPAQI